jgi:hypothetical protein
VTPLYFPRGTGFAALVELDSVPWGRLTHAYGTGITGLGPTHDVKSALLLLGTDFDGALDALYSNVLHQGTVYEASAYAVPFMAALIAGKIDHESRVQLVRLLGALARSGSYEARSGSHSGAWGADVSARAFEAFKGSAAQLKAAAAQVDAELAEVILAIIAAMETPSIEMSAFLDDTLERFDDARSADV